MPPLRYTLAGQAGVAGRCATAPVDAMAHFSAASG